MRNIIKKLGILLLTLLVITGCSSKESKPNTDKPPIQDDINKPSDDVNKPTDDGRSKVLMDLMSSKEYTIKIKQSTSMDDFSMDSTIHTAVSGDKVYLKTEAGSMSLEFIIKDKMSYIIMHDSKTILKSDLSDEDDDEDINETIFSDNSKFVRKGKELFLDNERTFEEYEVEDGTVKYYFDGDELDGMIMVLDIEDDEENVSKDGKVTVVMDILSYDKKADQSLFELPQDYQIMGD